MKLVEISKNQLNRFVREKNFSQFLQSWEWGEFQEKSGFKILRLGVEEGGELAAAATLIKKNLGMGKSFFYCPRGPITNFQFSIFTRQASTSNFQTISNELILKHQKVLFFLFKEIEKIAKKEKAVFLRFEPGIKYPLSNTHYPITETIDVQPSKTIILDLKRTEEELLSDMHQKTRYNIRLARRKGVKVRKADTQNFLSDFDKFWEIMEETVKRDKFRLHSREHYRRMLEIKNDNVELILAEYKREIIAGNIMSFFGDTAVYIHGASSNKKRNVMAPFILQWEAIKIARKKGCLYYDFYGIDENKWPGVTRFKKGFGGDKVNLPGTFDLIINRNWYKIYKFIRSARRLTS